MRRGHVPHLGRRVPHLGGGLPDVLPDGSLQDRVRPRPDDVRPSGDDLRANQILPGLHVDGAHVHRVGACQQLQPGVRRQLLLSGTAEESNHSCGGGGGGGRGGARAAPRRLGACQAAANIAVTANN